MERNPDKSNQLVVKESPIEGDEIIFDLVIKEKLAHVIVIKQADKYHINLDGEDLGSFEKDNDGKITRYGQTKGAYANYEEYFKPIEAKIASLGK